MLDLKQREKSAAPDAGQDHLRECAAKVRQVVNSVDEIIWAINPRNDNVRYLVDYLSQFAVEFLHAANIRCRVNLPEHFPDRAVSPEARHNLFMAVKEALNNVARHARATEVKLRVTTTDERIEIAIDDNGQGFAHAPDNARSDGLRNMRQRMEEIGGQLILESQPGSGTRIQFLYHWPPAAELH
jgi:signal transduction histidine kinase